MNVVINFNRDNQQAAQLLFETIMTVREGIEVCYYIQYCDEITTLLINDTVLKFLQNKNAQFSACLPDIKITHDMIMKDPNAHRYAGNHSIQPRVSKLRFFGWNLTA